MMIAEAAKECPRQSGIPATVTFYTPRRRAQGYDVKRQPGVTKMSLLHNELARWKFEDLATSDGHGLQCTFSCSALGLADPTERRMLQEVLLQSRTSVTDND